MPSGTEPLYCRVAAGAYPAYRSLSGSHLVGPVNAAPPGDAIRHRAALLPGGGWRLPGLPGLSHDPPVGPVSAAPPGDAIRHGAAFMPGGGWRLTRPTVASCLAFLSPPGRGIASGAGAVQPRPAPRSARRAAKLHLSHAGGAGDRRGHPFAADQPREGHSAGFAPCSSATAAGYR